MRSTNLIVKLLISLFMLLILTTGVAQGNSSPSQESSSPASVTTAVQDEGAQSVETAGKGPIQGCEPAVQKGPFIIPAEGGKAIRTFTGPWIFHAWWNNGADSVKNLWWNPGEPPWGQIEIKFKIPAGVKIETHGLGGTGWDYVPECQRRLFKEFQNGPEFPAKSLAELIELGLVRRLN